MKIKKEFKVESNGTEYLVKVKNIKLWDGKFGLQVSLKERKEILGREVWREVLQDCFPIDWNVRKAVRKSIEIYEYRKQKKKEENEMIEMNKRILENWS